MTWDTALEKVNRVGQVILDALGYQTICDTAEHALCVACTLKAQTTLMHTVLWEHVHYRNSMLHRVNGSTQAGTVRGRLGSVGSMFGSTVQAMKLLGLFSKITKAGQQLKLKTAKGMTSENHQLQLQLLANIVQLLVPVAPVCDITSCLIVPFRQKAFGAGLRYCSCALHCSPHLTSPHLTSPHLTSPHLTSPHLTSPHLTSPHLSPLQYQHSTAQHSTAQHSTAQHSTAQHSTAQHSTARHSTAQHST